MLIDEFTLVAQIINFLVLMWLLKRYLYKPVLNAIDAREQRITQQLAKAKAIEQSATQQRIEYETKNNDFQQQHTVLMQQVQAQAEITRQQLLESTRSEALALRSQWQESLAKEQQSLSQSIATLTRQEVFRITRTVLAQLANADLEARMIDLFIERLEHLNNTQIMALSEQMEQADSQIIVRTAHRLNADAKASLTLAIHSVLATHKTIQFDIDPDLLGGIELLSSGHKLAWNIADYVSELEDNISGLLDKKLVNTAIGG